MNNRGAARILIKNLVFSWTAFLLTGGFCARALEFSSDKADVLYQKEGVRGNSDWPDLYAKGDYNGDGYKDIVMIWDTGLFHWKALVIPGGPNMSGGPAEDRAITTISSQEAPALRDLGFYSADLDNDGCDDMIFSYYVFSNGESHQFVDIYYGSDPFGPSMDLGTNPDLKIVTQSTTSTSIRVIAGDVNGDGKTDLLVGSPNDNSYEGKVFLIPGTGSRRTGVFNASSGAGVITFHGPAGSSRLGNDLLLGELNNDGKRDILFPLFKDPPGRSNVGMVYVVFGSTAFPSAWDFSSSTQAPNVALLGDTIQFSALVAGDINGDGLDEIHVSNAYPDPVIADQTINVIVPGTSFNSGAPVVDLRATSADFRPVIEVDRHGPFDNGYLAAGDFDGDHRADLASTFPFSSSTTVLTVTLRLSSDIHEFPVPVLSTGALVLKNTFGVCHNASMGDVNGDGFDDLILGEKGATGTFWGLVIYGFHPLDNPAIHFPERGASPTERQADFSVDGDPTEMRLDGDGDPVLMNRWIPFQRSMRLSLTPGTGSRTVGVTFRNRFGRESSRAQDTVTLGVEGVATRPLTTVIRRGGAPIRIECQLTSSGHIKVWVMDRRGETIATLFDEERGAGLWPVDWDGRNGAGEPVAPGIYVLHIETPGGSEKKSIVVQ